MNRFLLVYSKPLRIVKIIGITYNYSCSFTEWQGTHQYDFHHMRDSLEAIYHLSTFPLCRSLLFQIPVLTATTFNKSYQTSEKLLRLALLKQVTGNSKHAVAQKENSYLYIGQHVLLSNPSCGKLDPRWSGPWTVTELKDPTSVTIKMGRSEKTVHTNRLNPLL